MKKKQKVVTKKLIARRLRRIEQRLAAIETRLKVMPIMWKSQ